MGDARVSAHSCGLCASVRLPQAYNVHVIVLPEFPNAQNMPTREGQRLSPSRSHQVCGRPSPRRLHLFCTCRDCRHHRTRSPRRARAAMLGRHPTTGIGRLATPKPRCVSPRHAWSDSLVRCPDSLLFGGLFVVGSWALSAPGGSCRGAARESSWVTCPCRTGLGGGRSRRGACLGRQRCSARRCSSTRGPRGG